MKLRWRAPLTRFEFHLTITAFLELDTKRARLVYLSSPALLIRVILFAIMPVPGCLINPELEGLAIGLLKGDWRVLRLRSDMIFAGVVITIMIFIVSYR